MILARDLGCSPWPAALIGLSYGLATPAYVYATLAYGHQASAFALLALVPPALEKGPASRMRLRIFLAGFLAAYASVIELQVAPVSAILALYLMVQWVQGTRRFDRLCDLRPGGPAADARAACLQPARASARRGTWVTSTMRPRNSPMCTTATTRWA